MKRMTGRLLETKYVHTDIHGISISKHFSALGSFLQTKACSATRYTQQIKGSKEHSFEARTCVGPSSWKMHMD